MEMTEIVELRKKMGLTQRDLAKMLGFDPWTVNRMGNRESRSICQRARGIGKLS